MSSGHIVFGRGDSVWAAPFDEERLELTDDPFPVVEGVQDLGGSGGTQFAASRNGTLVYLSGLGQPNRTLVWVSRDGTEEPLPTDTRGYLYPRISPDGQSVALSLIDPFDIWSWSLTRETLSRFTFGEGNNTYPTFSPDGGTLVFSSTRGGGVRNLFRQAADGTGSVERLTESANPQRPSAISPDGKWLVFAEIRGVGQDLFLLSLESDDQPAEALMQTEFDERNAEISPDGNWLVYESDSSGQYEVYVRPFPEVAEGLQQVSSDGGRMPLWSHGGRTFLLGSWWAHDGGSDRNRFLTNSWQSGNAL